MTLTRADLERLLEQGELAPELLTSEAALQECIRTHPALLWKAMNVRQHKGRKR